MCVYGWMCSTSTHTSDCKTVTDFVTVTTFESNFLPLTISTIVRSILCRAAVQLAVRSVLSGGGPSQCPCLIPLTYEGKLASGSHEARPLLHNICGLWGHTCDTLTPCCCPFLEILLKGSFHHLTWCLERWNQLPVGPETGKETTGQRRLLVTAASRVCLFKLSARESGLSR